MEAVKPLLDVSWETILKVCLAGLIFYILYLVRDIALWFFFGLIVSVTLEPVVNFFMRFRVPKIASVIITYILIFGIFALVVWLMAPIFVDEIKQFSTQLPKYFNNISPIFKGLKIQALDNVESFSQVITDNLDSISTNIINGLSSLFGGLVSAISIISIAFFLSLEDNAVERVMMLLTPKKHEDLVLSIFERCQSKIIGWFGTRILACIFVGAGSFIAFFLLGVKYSFILGFVAGILNFVPYIGPLAVIILLTLIVLAADTWIKWLAVLLAFGIIHGIEGNILTPILTKKFVGLPAVLVLLSLVVGGEIFGLLGAVFAIPVFGIVFEFTKEYLEKRKEEEALEPI